jgi:hypothetical protein
MSKVKNQAAEIIEIAKVLFSHVPSLNPDQVWDQALDKRILDFSAVSFPSENAEQQSYKRAVQSGLHIWNESLELSHSISQEIMTPTGSYWHGLMHRMEGDFSNAKYWFTDARHHPISTQLVTCLRSYLSEQHVTDLDHDTLRNKLEVLVSSPEWNPSVFVDAVELQLMHVQDPRAEEWLRRIQHFEVKLLLNYCYEQSYGGSLLEAIGQQ